MRAREIRTGLVAAEDTAPGYVELAMRTSTGDVYVCGLPCAQSASVVAHVQTCGRLLACKE